METTQRAACLSVAYPGRPVTTYNQLDGQGIVENTALAIPGHLGYPWASIEHVMIRRVTDAAVSSVGEHTQTTDEIYYIYRGEGILTTNGRQEHVASGCLVIAPKGTRHSLHNVSEQHDLAFLVVELAAPDNGATCPAQCLNLPQLLQPQHAISQLPHGPRVATIDLSQHFSGPWGLLQLVEMAGGERTESFQVEGFDRLIFVGEGLASILIEGTCISARQANLSVVVPAGMKHSIVNQSGERLLTYVCLQVGRQLTSSPRALDKR